MVKTTSRHTRLGLALAGIALMVGVTACAPGASNESGGELKSGDANTDFNTWNVKYTKCMTGEGVEMPEVASVESTGGGGAAQTFEIDDMAEFDAANKKCIAEVGEAPVQEGQLSDEEMKKAMLLFAKCMRDAGYDYPDPEFSGDGMAMGMAMSSDMDEADVDRCSTDAGFPEMGE